MSNAPLPIKFTREDATTLYIAIREAEAGLTPANSVAAADNFNLLQPCVSALDKGKNAFGRDTRRIAKEVEYRKLTAAEGDAALDKLSEDLRAKQEEEIALELLSIELSNDEIAASKLKPAHLAQFRRWLLPPKK